MSEVLLTTLRRVNPQTGGVPDREPAAQTAAARGGGRPMTLRYDDVALMVEQLTLREDVMSRLRRATMELDLSDEHVPIVNNACVAHLQERGFDQTGSPTDLGRRLERIIDALTYPFEDLKSDPAWDGISQSALWGTDGS